MKLYRLGQLMMGFGLTYFLPAIVGLENMASWILQMAAINCTVAAVVIPAMNYPKISQLVTPDHFALFLIFKLCLCCLSLSLFLGVFDFLVILQLSPINALTCCIGVIAICVFNLLNLHDQSLTSPVGVSKTTFFTTSAHLAIACLAGFVGCPPNLILAFAFLGYLPSILILFNNREWTFNTNTKAISQLKGHAKDYSVTALPILLSALFLNSFRVTPGTHRNTCIA